MKNKVLFYTLAFGNTVYYEQAELLIISLLCFKNETTKIRIYTDNPNFFTFYEQSANVEICPFSKENIEKIAKAHYGYPFANKLYLINKIAHENTHSASVFFDTDVVAIKSLEEFNAQLLNNSFFMYKKEKCYFNESQKEYWNALNSIDLIHYTVDKKSHQWNSGVVAINSSISSRINDAIFIMDNLLKFGVQQHTPEQVALSVVLEATHNLNDARDFFIHYHPNKKGWAILAQELNKKRANGADLCELMNWYKAIEVYPPEKLKPPVFYKKILFKWKNSIKKRLFKNEIKK